MFPCTVHTCKQVFILLIFKKNSGKPPFPLLKDFTEDDLEHLTQFLDSYHAGSSTDGRTNMGKIVGHLKEFREQQESGMTEWRAPQQQKKN